MTTTKLTTGAPKGAPRCLVLWHSTTPKAARSILRTGFKDGYGFYLTTSIRGGVWLSNFALNGNEGARGDTVLKVRLAMSEREIAGYEWIEDGKPYREWLIPAEVVNRHAKISIATDEEVDRANHYRWSRTRRTGGLIAIERGT